MRPLVPVLVLLLLAPPALAAFSGRDAAVAWLDAAQGADGGWTDRPTTDWVMLGLAAAGDDVPARELDAFLLAHPPEPTSLLAWERATLALACAGYDARGFHGVDHALVVEAHFLGTQFGNPSWLHDDYWAILALRAAGTPADDLRLRLSATYVLDGRHPSGGWGWAKGGTPDPDDTGAALMALAAAAHPERGPAVADALAYLRATQNPDGGWGLAGGSTSNLLSTSWATMGLLASGEDVETAWDAATGPGPLDLLASLQRADGSFDYQAGRASSERAALTATALPPLLGKSYFCPP